MITRMTKKKLTEAIKFLNPKTGIKDVVDSCVKELEDDPTERRRMYPGDASSCVLATAWKDGHEHIEVCNDEVYIYITDESFNKVLNMGIKYIRLHKNKIGINHKYGEVVKWFDTLYNSKNAARTVLEILGYTEDGMVKPRATSKSTTT